MPTPPSTPHSSPSHAANSLSFRFEQIAENRSAEPNDNKQEQTHFIGLGDGELTQTLQNDRAEVRGEIDAMLPDLPPVQRTAPPPLLALLSVDTEPSVTVGYRTAPYPMSSIDIKKDFIEMRALIAMLEISTSGLTACSNINRPKLAMLMQDMEISLAWQSAQEVFKKAEERSQISSDISMSDQASPPDFIFSIQEQIDLTKHQISLMKEFSSRINSIKPDDLKVTALSFKSEQANNLNNNVPFIDDFSDWNYAISREEFSISFSHPKNPTTLMVSAIQFWGELLQITISSRLDFQKIIIEDNDFFLKSIDLIEKALDHAQAEH